MENLSELLEAVNSGLSVVKRVAELPGVNVLPYATTLSTAISAVQVAVEAGKSIAPYVVAIKETFSGGTTPTQAQLDALDARIAELRAELHAPLPAKEEGEPD